MPASADVAEYVGDTVQGRRVDGGGKGMVGEGEGSRLSRGRAYDVLEGRWWIKEVYVDKAQVMF